MGRTPAKPKDDTQPGTAVANFEPARLPYHPHVEEAFGVTKGQWKVLTDAIFPAAKTPDAIVLALSYCKSRNLDIMKRPVHIVPMWDSKKNETVETIWPSIAELRTTAARTHEYAGCDEAEWGPFTEVTFTGRGKVWSEEKGKMDWSDITATVNYPEWCRITVYRMIGGQPRKFVGPKVLWLESYATIGASDVPNKMWQERPEGQLEKCAEAAALRRAFPEEIGNELTAEEMHGRRIDDAAAAVEVTDAAPKGDAGPPKPAAIAPPPADTTPPKGPAGKPEPERLPDAEVEGEDDQPEQDQPAEQNDMGFEESKPREEPIMLSGKGHTFASWADLYIEKINACVEAPEVYAWVDANVGPIEHLSKKAPDEARRATAAVAKKLAALRGGEPEKAPAEKEPAKRDAGPPKPRAKKADKAAEGPGPRPSPAIPEDFLKWVDATLGAVTDGELLSGVYTEQVEPFIEELTPPDQSECIGLYRKHERRLEP